MSSGIISPRATVIPKRESEGDGANINEEGCREARREAGFPAGASMEVPGTPEGVCTSADEKMLRIVGEEFQLDVAPQAVTLTGNADLGEWKRLTLGGAQLERPSVWHHHVPWAIVREHVAEGLQADSEGREARWRRICPPPLRLQAHRGVANRRRGIRTLA